MIAVDDMSARDLRAMPIVRHLFGDRGVQFVNSFSPFPLCCPARVSMLTGQYAHNHGVLGNDDPAFPEGGYGGFTSDDNTVATWLDHAGYQTAFVGKYLNHYGEHGNAARVPPGWTSGTARCPAATRCPRSSRTTARCTRTRRTAAPGPPTPWSTSSAAGSGDPHR